MAKMKYSEIPRDLSSDSIAAYRLAQVKKRNDRFVMDTVVTICFVFCSTRDRLIETNGRETRVRVEVVPNQELHLVILHLSDSFTNSCRRVGQLQLFVHTA
jgi:hypothetical protein